MKTKEKNKKINFLNNGSFIQRFFTKTNIHPYDEVKWVKTTAEIPGSDFKMEDVEFPDFYSQNAINIIASKYFKINRGKQEKSLKELIDRVVKTFKKWGLEQGYFDEKSAEIYEKELTYIILHQYATFNSPVWFNVGVEGRSQQCSACQPYRSLVSTPFGFIPIGKIVEERLIGLPVYDSKGVTFVTGVKENGFKEVYKIYLKNGLYIEATGDHLVKVSDVYDRDGNKFKWLRVDKLKPGMRLYVHFHNVFSEKTYPVEKNVDANQIIYCQSANSSVLTKSKIEIRYSNLQKLVDEATLAGWLQGDGFVGKYSSGTNKSWIIEFIAVNEEQLNYLLSKIEKVFEGVHYKIREAFTKTDRRIWRIRLYGNKLKNFIEKYDLVKRREDMRVPQVLFGAPREVVASYLRSFFDCEGYVSFRKDKKYNYEQSKIGAATISKNLMEDILILLTGLGIYAKLYRKKEKRQNRQDTYCIEITYGNSKKLFAELIGFISKEKIEKLKIILNEFKHKNHNPFRNEEIIKIEKLAVEKVYDIQTLSGEYLSNNVAIHNCFILDVEDNMESILDWIKIEGMVFKGGSGSGVNLSKLRAKGEKLSTGGSSSGVISFMRAADAVAGSIKSGGSTRRAAKMVILNADHPEIMDFIRVKAEEENKVRALMEAGYDMTDMNNPLWQNIFFQNANNSVRIPDALMEAAIKDGEWKTYYRTTGGVAKVYKAKDILWEIAKAAWECGDPGVQFDDIIQKWHTCKNSGRIEATNPCSEYLHLNWTSCNLSSINLLKFLKEDGSFDVPAFIHTARVMFLSQDLLISKADYPHPKIAEETKKYRTIGLGYTNLGALIMALGLPYDSDEARDLAASITALMTGTAYKLSTEISNKLGPFPEYERNKEPMMEVMKMHKDHLKYVKENEFNKEILEKAKEVWSEVIELGEKYGFRNAQATVIAPTGCLVGESLISTERGLVPIQTLGNPLGAKWQNLNIEVMTDEGPQLASQFYVNGLAETRKIRTKNGYEIIGTPEHRIKVFDKETGTLKWKYFADIKDGDIVALEMNTIFGSPQPIKLPPLPELYWTSDFETKVPEFMNEELAEIVGYFMGDGSLHSKGLRFCVYKEDKDVIERLKTILHNQFNLKANLTSKRGYIEISVNSVPLTLWWQACGFSKIKTKEGKGWKPHIPLAILYSNDKKIYSAFLRGIFEADGTVWKDSKTPAFCTHDKDFHDQVKYLLLALGYPTKSKIGVSGWGRNNLYVLYIKNRDYSKKFREEIGFIGERKNKLIENIIVKKSQVKMDQIYLSESIIQEFLPVLSKREKDSLRLEFRRKGAITRTFALRILEKTKNNLLEFYTQKIFFDKVILNESAGEKLTYDLSVPSNVTYIANGFISHNTISFMMDADTTGIEPDFALVKMKQLVGGGYMKIVNKTVPLALKRLEYTEEQIKDIIKHLEETQNIEYAPHLKEEHLSVFDCAIKPPGGKRSIHWLGHVKMVAAVQPFISGGISKTFNMPNETTIQEIYDAYFTAWRLGIKCFAVYRDGSKATQALYTEKKEKKLKEKIERRKLPLVRQSETHKFSVAGHEGYLTYSTFEDGSLGEIFIRMSKQGSTLAGLLDAFAIAVSIALQYGVPLKELANKFIYMRFEPMGITNNEDIPIASSIVDYIFKYLALRFLTPEELKEIGLEVKEKSILKEHPKLIENNLAIGKENNNLARLDSGKLTGPPCKYCGGMTTRTGSCYTCLECGESSGGCG